ncbi:MAG: hypothetical protein ACOX1S_15240 [Anaerostipes sp.]|jgi:hypothetical protein
MGELDQEEEEKGILDGSNTVLFLRIIPNVVITTSLLNKFM